MKKILLIAYEFYPLNTGGSHRPFRMAKFLKDNGYHPVVITNQIEENQVDESLQKIVKESEIEVVSVPTRSEDFYTKLSTYYYFNVVDDTYRRWGASVLSEIDNILQKESFLAAIVTVPPFSVSSFVEELKKRSLITFLDLRDAWSLWNVSPYASKIHYGLTKKVEHKALALSDFNLVTSEVTLDDFKELYPKINPHKYLYVPNSFDTYVASQPDEVRVSTKDKVKIGYVGSFYFNPQSERLNALSWYQKKPYQWFQYLPFKEEWVYRSPYFVFRAISEFIKKHPEHKTKIELHFAGNKPQWFQSFVDDFNLQDIVFHHGKIDKSEVVSFQDKMDLLLLTSSKRHGSIDYSIAGKTFEYFSQIKPILAFVTEGAQSDVLEPSGLSIILNPDDLNDSIEKLKQICDFEVIMKPNYNWLEQFKTDSTLLPLLEKLKQI